MYTWPRYASSYIYSEIFAVFKKFGKNFKNFVKTKRFIFMLDFLTVVTLGQCLTLLW